MAPRLTTVKTTVHNTDSGRSRTGTTAVADSDVLAGITPYAVLANFDTTFDEVGRGRAESSWTIHGTRSGGKAFVVKRSNRWASTDDIAYDPAVELADAVNQLATNEFEKVTVTSIGFDSTVTQKFSQTRITDVAVAVNKAKFTKASTVKAKAGDTLRIQITLRAYQSSTTTKPVITVKVPKKAKGTFGSLLVSGGANADSANEDNLACLLLGEGCDTNSAASFKALTKSIESAPRNDDLLATLSLDSDSSKKSTTVSGMSHQKSVVTGQREISVEVR